MFAKYLLLFIFTASAALPAAEVAAERYTKVRNGSLPRIFTTTKSQCFSQLLPLNGNLPVIVLDEDIYKQLNSTYTNIAVADEQNQLLPFVIQKLYKYNTVTNYAPLSGKITNFAIDQQKNEAVIEYELSGNTAAAIGKLSLEPYGRKKFNKTITLEFDDQSKVENLKFFNHRSVVDFSRHTFEFAPKKTKNIRIKIAPFAEKHSHASQLVRSGDKENFTEKRILTEELNLHKITFYQARTKLYPAWEMEKSKRFPVREIPGKANQSVWEFTLDQYPVKDLQIVSTTPNYHRKYELEFKINIKETNQEATLCRFSGVLKPGNKLEFNDIRAVRAILTIENQSDTPLTDVDFKWMTPQEGIILDPASDVKEFKLYYGGEVGKLPEFDFKHYVDKYNGKEYTFLELGSEEVNKAFKEADYTATDFLKKLLPYIIGLAALFIAWVSFKMLKNVKIANEE